MGQFDHPVHRNERIRVKNTHTGAEYGVTAHSGAMWRTLMPSGGIWGCQTGPPKQAQFWRDQAVEWGAFLCHNGPPQRPNCTGRLIGALCDYFGGRAHRNHQSRWSLGHLVIAKEHMVIPTISKALGGHHPRVMDTLLFFMAHTVPNTTTKQLKRH